MRRLISILLASVIFCGALTSCVQGAETPAFSKEQAEEKAAVHCNMIIEGRYDELTQDMSTEMKSTLSTEQIKAAWEPIITSAGADLGEKTVDVTKKEGDTITVATHLKYENMGIKISTTYNTSGKLIGLFFSKTQNGDNLVSTDLYTQEKIEVGEYKLTGILTRPRDVENPPVVVMLQGSGQSDYDETISVLKPFRDIASDLAEKGIATIRFNKRYFQHPELASAKITVKDEYMEDIAAAIALAKEKVGENIYFLGHSLGGMSAPKIAQDNLSVKGIISLAGSPRGLEDIIYDQNKAAINAMETTKQQKDLLLKNVKKSVDEVKKLKGDDGSSHFGTTAGYWLSLKELDTLNISKSLTIPMLILQGSADFQVYKDKDFEYWKTQLKGKENASFKLYDGLNHMFMKSVYNGEANTAEYDVPATVEKQVTEDIAQWIFEILEVKIEE